MEECFDQNEEIFFPAEGSAFVAREHERFGEIEGIDALLSVPLRIKGLPIGVILLERNEDAFTIEEIYSLRLAADLSATFLEDLRTRSRWFGFRLLVSFRDSLSGFFGPVGLWWKMMLFLILTFFVTAAFLPWRFRLDADFILKTDATTYVTAPFDGFIGEVNATIGDVITPSQSLLIMDTNDLEVRIVEVEAKHTRQRAEERSARSEGAFAEAESARLRAREAEAELRLLRKRLERSVLRSQFSGLVVEGDLRERIGSPVKQGEVLFKVARLEGLFPQLNIDEREVLEVDVGALGESAFVSRPDHRFAFHVVRLDPAAVPTKEGNVFRARAEFLNPPETWWRPGMEGVAKIDAGERTILWILTRRAVDWLRLKFWL